MMAKMLSEMLKLPVYRIEVDVPLEQYGIDSVAMMKLTDDLEKVLGPLPKTLFFEYPTLEAVSTRSEEHTSELQSLMRISYAVFCLKKKNKNNITITKKQTKQSK